MDIKQFNSNVKGIKVASAKNDVLLHECAMFALEQINLHGNNGPMNQLKSALGKAHRGEALVVWFLDHGLCKRDTKNNILVHSSGKKIKIDGEEVSVEGALILADEKPFYTYTKETTPATVLDIEKAVQSLLARIANASKNGIKIEHAELKAQLETMVPAKV